tara:strand:+ start:50773 stop:50946 length:174 start_codon:yes stop_codon:yes gene_type:complete
LTEDPQQFEATKGAAAVGGKAIYRRLFEIADETGGLQRAEPEPQFRCVLGVFAAGAL